MQGIIINIHMSSCKSTHYYCQISIKLSTDLTSLSARMFNLRLTHRQDCQWCGDKKEDSEHIACHCQTKDTEPCVIMFLMTKDLENMRVNGLISLVANTRLGIIHQPHFKTAMR